jgi:hypothetical protein
MFYVPFITYVYVCSTVFHMCATKRSPIARANVVARPLSSGILSNIETVRRYIIYISDLSNVHGRRPEREKMFLQYKRSTFVSITVAVDVFRQLLCPSPLSHPFDFAKNNTRLHQLVLNCAHWLRKRNVRECDILSESSLTKLARTRVSTGKRGAPRCGILILAI